MEEKNTFQKTACRAVGILLAIESALLLILACFGGPIMLLAAGLSLASGAGGASDEQIAKTGWLLAYMVVAPFVVVVLLSISSWNLFGQTKLTLIKYLCGTSLIIHAVTVILLKSHSIAFIVLPIVAPLTGFLLTFWTKPKAPQHIKASE